MTSELFVIIHVNVLNYKFRNEILVSLIDSALIVERLFIMINQIE